MTGCQAQNWPAASFLPGEAAPWAVEQCGVRRPRPFLACGGPAGVAGCPPPCPWGGRWWSQPCPPPALPGRGGLPQDSQQLLGRGLRPQKGTVRGFKLFCSIPENLTETSSPAGTTQADRNNQRLYLDWNGISSGVTRHLVPNRSSLADKSVFEPQKVEAWWGGGHKGWLSTRCFLGGLDLANLQGKKVKSVSPLVMSNSLRFHRL